jgi:hypothetical protein
MMLDCGRRLIILPLAIQIGGWIYYFAALQTAFGMTGKKLKAETLKS